jgi:uncharacterized membrane protein YccF (DUF307 family)
VRVEGERIEGVADVRVVLNLLWLVLAGFWMFLAYLVVGALWCLTIIGIPLGLANFKLIPISLLPLGKDIVPTHA